MVLNKTLLSFQHLKMENCPHFLVVQRTMEMYVKFLSILFKFWAFALLTEGLPAYASLFSLCHQMQMIICAWIWYTQFVIVYNFHI